MSSKGVSTKKVLQEHSQAKVKLYTEYLRVYLSIMGNTRFSRIHLYDVLCGEGKYKDGAEGSALKALRTVLSYYSDYPHSQLRLNVRLNDFGQSDVEAGLRKIDRVETHASKIPLPTSKVTVGYSGVEYAEMLQEVEQTVAKLSSVEKALVFIDPWGYKSIRPGQLQSLFSSGSTEILLFLPTTHMYRFANKAAEDIPEEEVLQCFKPLKRLLEELFGSSIPRFSCLDDFAKALKIKLAEALGAEYCSAFALETNEFNEYTLFFFTPNVKGLDVFNQACWKLDSNYGRKYSMRAASGQMLLFAPQDEHIGQVRDLIFSSPVTNRQLYEFGVKCGYLTKATNAALNCLRESGEIDVVALDGLDKPKKRANYLDYKPKRTVQFKKMT
ncbi:three-Cys-motif partner protein TcmP [Solirubrum puertoriconensis]|uniref:Three-Cys-motif partner protein TcmP n=1 Tax=Solirubrum puertoriconensis TaxID=1751427 RepID=A0A9X0HIB0_SOLP1|nr:three-Cys-motif partner protein TcmP [Solirubrum puertoriconensis]KUG06370.1 hypothetical protein ASU33_03160 [Solirubrum puertoriconensis]